MFNIPEKEIGTVSSNLVVYSIPVTMVTLFFVSYAFEILGRKYTLFLSFFITSIFYFFLPRTSPSYSYLMFVRCLIAFSMAAPISHPLIADYIHRDSRGKAVALMGVGTVCGEIIGMCIFKLNTTLNMDFYQSFTCTSILIMFFSFYCAWAVKDPDLKRLHRNLKDGNNPESSFENMTLV